MAPRSLIVDAPFAAGQRLERLLAAHHLVTTYVDTEVFLAVVGPVIDAHYAHVLQRYCDELNLQRTWLGHDEASAAAAAGPDHVRVSWLTDLAEVELERLADALVELSRHR